MSVKQIQITSIFYVFQHRYFLVVSAPVKSAHSIESEFEKIEIIDTKRSSDSLRAFDARSSVVPVNWYFIYRDFLWIFVFKLLIVYKIHVVIMDIWYQVLAVEVLLYHDGLFLSTSKFRCNRDKSIEL